LIQDISNGVAGRQFGLLRGSYEKERHFSINTLGSKPISIDQIEMPHGASAWQRTGVERPCPSSFFLNLLAFPSFTWSRRSWESVARQGSSGRTESQDRMDQAIVGSWQRQVKAW
jgi:hypothetical protein